MTKERLSAGEAAKFLYENGLLFEINRRVLHPLGVSLVVVEDTVTGEYDFYGLNLDDDPEGTWFIPDCFAQGSERLRVFMEKMGLDRLATRQQALGYIEQEDEEERHV